MHCGSAGKGRWKNVRAEHDTDTSAEPRQVNERMEASTVSGDTRARGGCKTATATGDAAAGEYAVAAGPGNAATVGPNGVHDAGTPAGRGNESSTATGSIGVSDTDKTEGDGRCIDSFTCSKNEGFLTCAGGSRVLEHLVGMGTNK